MEGKSDPLAEFANTFAEKTPNSIKEIVRVLTDMTSRFVEVMTELKDEVKQLQSSNTAIQTELTSVRTGMDFMNENFEEFKTEVQTLRKELDDAKKLGLECQKENRILSKELAETKKQLIELKQYSRNNNLELKGIPVADSEDLNKVVETVASCLSTELPSHAIEVAHRVATKAKGPPNVIVRFASRTNRDKFLAAAKKSRLNVSMLGFEGTDPIFVNEHLCPENKILLGKAIQTKRDVGWKFAWVSEGKILMRKAEKSKVVHVTCEADLERITRAQGTQAQSDNNPDLSS